MPKEDVNVDHYATLSLAKSATAEEVKKQFRRLALVYHPDRNIGRETEVNAKFQAIQAAHEVLIDPIRRKVYDRSRQIHAVTSTSSSTTVPKPASAYSSASKPYSTATRNGTFASGPKTTEGPFSAKNQWNPRAYGYGGQSAHVRGKTTGGMPEFDRFSREEIPRTPKKTRENPYVSQSQPPTPNMEHRRFDGRSTFFADRNPREKEWMDDGYSEKPSKASRSKSNEQMGSSSVPLKSRPQPSTAYSFTPRERTRTNPFDDVPLPRKPAGDEMPIPTKPANEESAEWTNEASRRPTSERKKTAGFSPHEAHPTQYRARRKSSSSAAGDVSAGVGERRRFSYLFTDDSTRKPHRPSRQAEVEDYTDEEDGPTLGGKNVFATMGRNGPSQPKRSSVEEQSRNTEFSTPFGKHSQTARDNISQWFTTESATPSLAQQFADGTSSSSSNKDPKQKSPIKGKGAERERLRRERAKARSEKEKKATVGFSSMSGPSDAEEVSPGSMGVPPTTTFDFSFKLQTQKEQKDSVAYAFAQGQRHDEQTNETSFAAPTNPWNVTFSQSNQNEPQLHTQSNPTNLKLDTEFVTGPTNFASHFAESFTDSQPVESPTNLAQSPSKDQPSSNERDENQTLHRNSIPPASFMADDWKNIFDKNPNTFDVNLTKAANPIAGTNFKPHQRTRGGAKPNNPRKAPLMAQMKGLGIGSDEENFNGIKNSHTTNTASYSDSAWLATPKADPQMPVHGQDPDVNAPSPMAMDLDSPMPSHDDLKTEFTSGLPVSPITSNCPPILAKTKPFLQREAAAMPVKKPPSPKKQRPNNTESDINLASLGSVEPLRPIPSQNGINGHWAEFKDNLPFMSKAAPVIDNISPPSSPSKETNLSFVAPIFPSPPNEVSETAYNRYCNTMIVYQTTWNEFNTQVVNHLKHRSEVSMTKCAQDEGFASGYTHSQAHGLASAIQKDLVTAAKALKDVQSDRKVRDAWEEATMLHIQVLADWIKYLEKCKNSSRV